MTTGGWFQNIFGPKPQAKPEPTTPAKPPDPAISWDSYERILMALCIWREARGEPEQGQEWVAWVIRNRRDHRGWWNRSGTLAEVLLLPQQFSSLTDKGDSQLSAFPYPVRSGTIYNPDPTFCRILDIVNRVLAAPASADPTHGSDHYHSISIAPPNWASADKMTGSVGRHRFYRLFS